ncbi:transient receptor potential cation channel subfamily M member 8-like [Babylonia areolata]|uniref:transient receptor potential cation channel subfamily M member 8-like n=1 Tax=Babylonia areolata TaxID=304850 RepID=UPI003FD26DC3
MATGGWRVHPTEEMSMARSSAVSAISHGGISMPHLKNKAPRNESSLEQAYWSGMRKRMGLSGLDKEESAESEERKYEMLRKDMARYVENSFHQKECIFFVPKPNQTVAMNKQLKCHCGEILSNHVWGRSVKEPIDRYVHEDFIELARNPTGRPPEIRKVPWDPARNLSTKRSFTYGKMSFNVESSSGRKPAKYLRLSNEDSVDACLEYMEVFWHIMEPSPPNLVISVVGGAKNFRLDGEMRDTFANGIIKAAKTTNAWLITSGFNMGVMKSVGQAVHEGQAFLWDKDRMTHLLRCIAIAPWGYVYNRRFLEGRNRMGKFNAYYRASNMILHGQPVSLNPDHTHFIFVDDGMRNRYGGVADFRAHFERKLCTPKSENGYGIPVVMIVVEGGPDAIHDVCQSLMKGVPVVVCTGTGRAADFLTYAHKFTFKDRNGEITMNERQRKTLEDRVARAYSKNWGDKAESELQVVMNKIDECMKRDDLMIFFDLRREEDLDVAILSVLTKAETTAGAKHRLNQLELALTWNRADIAQSEIFREDVNWDSSELYQIMTKALKEDKMSFVRLLLNQGVSMKEYLTVPRLEDLYNSVPKHSFLHLILKRNLGKEEFSIQDIGKFLEKMLDRFDDDKFVPPASKLGSLGRFRPGSSRRGRAMDTTDTEAEEEPNQFKRPYKQLMIWAVLLNRQELAKFFWEMGDEPITSALSASLLCVKMHRHVPKYLHSVRQDFLQMRKTFEELATKVLDECHAQDPEKAIMLVERKSPAWSRMTCMQIAASSVDQHFVSSVACQNSVNNVWKSAILSDWRRVAICGLFPFLILPLIHVVHMGDKAVSRWQKVQIFLTAPITKFFYHMLSYLIFLGLYSYMVLVDFQKYPSHLEFVLMIWILTIFLGEVYTFITFPSATLWGKVRDWFTFLNRLDMANLVLAFAGFLLRYNAEFYMQAKTIYCVNAVIFFIRIMKVYISNIHLGPKLYMILRMVEELLMFIVVLAVFLLAYGVCSQGLLYKKRDPSFQVFKDIIQFPYWQLYGEIFLEEIQTDEECLARLSNGTMVPPYENTCRESYWLVYIMLGLYLLVGNVLLLNLLIAIFSNVFNMVEENSIEIWKYQMYFLVMEFQCKAHLPPPLSVFQHVYFLFRFIFKKTCCKKKKRSEQFGQHQLAYLALFEKEMMANYLRRLKFESMDSMQRKFSKLQKRVDMLSKIIEDKHVEDELALQASLRLSDGLRVIRAVDRGASMLSSSDPTLTSSVLGTVSQLLPPGNDKVDGGGGGGGGEQKEKDEKKEGGKEGMSEEPEVEKKSRKATKETKVAFALDLPPGEEEKKKNKKKNKKKKEKREKSKERDPSQERKELNINLPEADTKPTLDKFISDENNDISDGARFVRALRSRSPTNSNQLFRVPPPTFLRTPPQAQSSTEGMQMDYADVSDLESEGAGSPVDRHSPKRPKSRAQLNKLSHTDTALNDAESDSSSDNSFVVHHPPPHHRPRKANRRKSPRRKASDSEDM